MPTLNWIGKEAVVKHHKEVPFRVLEPVPERSCDKVGAGDTASSGNLIVQGDNLHALKGAVARYAGQVKCIYIDPPYNTGNEGWAYNDNVNSPEIRRWLGEVVGKEGETLDRHDRWLSMMYPRLVLLKQFLRDDGAIFISIDDNEVATLRLLMDEIFGAKNFVATVLWQKIFSPKNSARHLSEDHDYIVLYASNADKWKPNLLPRGDDAKARYKNDDEDPRGPWTSGDLATLYDVSVPAISQHLKRIYADNELEREATVKQYLMVQTEGERAVQRKVDHYSLQAIIAVGFKIENERAVQFRKWANQIVKDYTIQGWTMDVDRLKGGGSIPTDKFFERQLEKVREIRLSERKFYQKITDIYGTSLDYDTSATATKRFFAAVQNKLHFAIHGQTAAEVIVDRADHQKDNMGLTHWQSVLQIQAACGRGIVREGLQLHPAVLLRYGHVIV
ncbi:MAG: virulence RhuM family protein [Propionivibrio sp.]|uniref:RhuM family protein n=1 Tax=Propionivibrio sp. TaxID=2212460 RepID=UPI0025EF3176|nr:RhuM family protein [Propionivibrio sp.]MBK8892825.1 virulence RhuM family protein [Propionivibrio sp.]